jgi:hypothetical protein
MRATASIFACTAASKPYYSYVTISAARRPILYVTFSPGQRLVVWSLA